MGRWLRGAVLAGLATPALVLALPGFAAAAPQRPATSALLSLKPAVAQSAWFRTTLVEQVNPPVAPPAGLPTEPSGVPAGDLAVAHTSTDGSSSKMSVIAFRVGTVNRNATVSTFTLRLTLDTSSSALNLGAASAPIVACLPTRVWASGEGVDYTQQPPVDCSLAVKPTVSGNTFTFKIPAIAQQWIGAANVGVALVNDPANTSTPFQAVFSGGTSIAASMTYFLPDVSPGPVSLGDTGTTTGGSSSSPSTPAVTPVSMPAPTGPTSLVTTPAPATTAPLVAASAAPLHAALLALHHKRAPALPPLQFWIAAAGLALLLLAAAAVLADDKVPAPTAGTTRLGLVLRERRRALPTRPDGTATLTLRRV